jgi:ABC-type branched-subunit amino acid transport system substrate-binding protein
MSNDHPDCDQPLPTRATSTHQFKSLDYNLKGRGEGNNTTSLPNAPQPATVLANHAAVTPTAGQGTPAIQPPPRSALPQQPTVPVGQGAIAIQSTSRKAKSGGAVICWISSIFTLITSTLISLYFSNFIGTIFSALLGSILAILVIAFLQTSCKPSEIRWGSWLIVFINILLLGFLYLSDSILTLRAIIGGVVLAIFVLIFVYSRKDTFEYFQLYLMKKKLRGKRHVAEIGYAAVVVIICGIALFYQGIYIHPSNILEYWPFLVSGIVTVSCMATPIISVRTSKRFEKWASRLIRRLVLVFPLFGKSTLRFYPMNLLLLIAWLILSQVLRSGSPTNLYPYCLVQAGAGWQWVCSQAITTESVLASGDHLTIGIIDGSNQSDQTAFDGDTDEANVIKAISAENKDALASSQYIDLVVATTLSRTPSDPNSSVSVGVEDLRGAYLKIQQYNEEKTKEGVAIHKVKVRLLIANIGTRKTVQTTVHQIMNQILVLSQQDVHFRGIIGLPFSVAVDEAIRSDWIHFGLKIPMVSPSATADGFSNIQKSYRLSNSPPFYRISSPNSAQACDMLKEIRRILEPAYQKTDPNHNLDQNGNPEFRVALFHDEGETYSSDLAKDFQNDHDRPLMLCPDQSPTIPIQIVDEQTSLNNLEPEVKDAVSQKADMIFFAGYTTNLNDFERYLEQAEQEQDYHIPIVGGDGLFDIARNITNPYSRVYSTTYASPVNNVGNASLSTFAKNYKSAFLSPNSSVSLLPPHAILSYDAAHVFTCALDKTMSSNSATPCNDIHSFNDQLPGQDKINTALGSVDFLGVSGQVHFTGEGNSDPYDKPIYIMCQDQGLQLHEAAEYDPGKDPTDFLGEGDIVNCGL